MEIIISVVVFVLLVVWMIKKRNSFVKLRERVNEQLSNISNYNEQRSRSINDAMGMLSVAHHNDIEAIKQLVGESQTTELLACGQKYPDLKNTPSYGMAVTKVQQCDAEIAACKNLLNIAVRKYNEAISEFPSNIVAGILRFKREEFIDEANMAANRSVEIGEINFDKYKM